MIANEKIKKIGDSNNYFKINESDLKKTIDDQKSQLNKAQNEKHNLDMRLEVKFLKFKKLY